MQWPFRVFGASGVASVKAAVCSPARGTIFGSCSMLPATLSPVVESAPAVTDTGPIVLPEEAREILADGFWRAANERLRQRKGLPPAPRSDCFPTSWFQHSFALD